MIRLLLILAFLGGGGCGHSKSTHPTPDNSAKIADLEKKILALQGTSSLISNLINSDFSTCTNSGDTSDPLINKICRVAQAATIEEIATLKGELATTNESITEEINSINDNLTQLATQEQVDTASITAQLGTISGQIASLAASLVSLGTRITSAESAISALQVLTNSITSILNGALTGLEIGSENLGAGPLFESVLRTTDKTRINAYVEAYGPNISLGSNSLNSTSGSPVVVVSAAAHGLVVGDVVHLGGLVGSNGFSNGDVVGDFVVNSTPTVNTFTVILRKNATSNGNFGGNNLPVIYKVLGRGLGTIWRISDGADSVVRVTTLGTRRYNFIIRAGGDICYDKTTPGQIFSVISAGGSSIICK